MLQNAAISRVSGLREKYIAMEGLNLVEEEGMVVDSVVIFGDFELQLWGGFGVDDLKRRDGGSGVLGNER